MQKCPTVQANDRKAQSNRTIKGAFEKGSKKFRSKPGERDRNEFEKLEHAIHCGTRPSFFAVVRIAVCDFACPKFELLPTDLSTRSSNWKALAFARHGFHRVRLGPPELLTGTKAPDKWLENECQVNYGDLWQATYNKRFVASALCGRQLTASNL